MPKVIEIDGGDHATYFRGNHKIVFSLVSRDNKLVRELASCRDYINDCVISYLNREEAPPGRHMGKWSKGRNAPPDFASLRLIMQRSANRRNGETQKLITERIFDAKRIINMYEELAGFARRSKIKQVKLKGINCWLLVGPSQWMKSTHLISMVTLIFRVVVERGGFHDCETLKQVEDRFGELCGGQRKATGSQCLALGSGDLNRLLPVSWPKFRMYMEMYNYIFGSKTKSFWSPLGGVGKWHGPGGIYSLSSKQVPAALRERIVRAEKLYKKKKA
jgi:hypothetical protein